MLISPFHCTIMQFAKSLVNMEHLLLSNSYFQLDIDLLHPITLISRIRSNAKPIGLSCSLHVFPMPVDALAAHCTTWLGIFFRASAWKWDETFYSSVYETKCELHLNANTSRRYEPALNARVVGRN